MKSLSFFFGRVTRLIFWSVAAAIAFQTLWLVSGTDRSDRTEIVSFHMMPRAVAGAAEELEPEMFVTRCVRRYLDGREYYDVTLVNPDNGSIMRLMLTPTGELVVRDRVSRVEKDELPFKPPSFSDTGAEFRKHNCGGRTVYSIIRFDGDKPVTKWFFPDGTEAGGADSPLAALSSMQLVSGGLE